jgi:hypothetical protein
VRSNPKTTQHRSVTQTTQRRSDDAPLVPGDDWRPTRIILFPTHFSHILSQLPIPSPKFHPHSPSLFSSCHLIQTHRLESLSPRPASEAGGQTDPPGGCFPRPPHGAKGNQLGRSGGTPQDALARDSHFGRWRGRCFGEAHMCDESRACARIGRCYGRVAVLGGNDTSFDMQPSVQSR